MRDPTDDIESAARPNWQESRDQIELRWSLDFLSMTLQLVQPFDGGFHQKKFMIYRYESGWQGALLDDETLGFGSSGPDVVNGVIQFQNIEDLPGLPKSKRINDLKRAIEVSPIRDAILAHKIETFFQHFLAIQRQYPDWKKHL